MLIKRIEGLLLQAQAGEITGLLAVVEQTSEDSPTYLWLDGSFRTNPHLAHAALLHGVTELFNKISADPAAQLRLDLK